MAVNECSFSSAGVVENARGVYVVAYSLFAHSKHWPLFDPELDRAHVRLAAPGRPGYEADPVDTGAEGLALRVTAGQPEGVAAGEHVTNPGEQSQKLS